MEIHRPHLKALTQEMRNSPPIPEFLKGNSPFPYGNCDFPYSNRDFHAANLFFCMLYRLLCRKSEFLGRNLTVRTGKAISHIAFRIAVREKPFSR
jgi:hypothetical protein